MSRPEVVDSFFADPMRFANGETALFSPEEKQHYEALGRITSPSSIYVYGNHEASRSGGYIKGYAAGFRANTPVHQFFSAGTAQLLNPRWFGHVVVLHVPGSALHPDMDESDMKKQIFSLRHSLNGTQTGDVLKQYAESLLANPRPTERDAAEFPNSLTGPSSMAGLMKKKNISLAEGGAAADYFLTVHTDAGVVGRAMQDRLSHGTALTLTELLDSNMYQAVKQYSERNAYRILAQLADVLHVDRDVVSRRSDELAALPANFRAVPELITEPYAESEYNLLHRSVSAPDTVLYYNATLRLLGQDSNSTNRRIVHLKNAKSGISVIQLDSTKDYTKPRRSVMSAGSSAAGVADATGNGGNSLVVSHPNPYAAFPVGTGRHEDKTRAFSELTAEDANALKESHTYVEKRGATGAAVRDFKTSAHPGLYSYKGMDTTSKSTQRFLLSGNATKLDLQAVAVILGE